ncbi:uncharacterized protein [Littorina saxatilis]|uniref:uncharacterized protein n=1 Tax=Littorina saxatilis TaxID=31220 RepID=UPI0038B5FCB3
MLENQSQSNQPSEDTPKAFKSQSIRNQLRTGKAVGGELYAEMSSGTANELQFRTKSLGKSVDPQPNNFQTTPAPDQSVNKDAGMPGSFPQSKMGEANDELNVLGRSTPTSGFHDAPRAAFGTKTDKSFTLEGARLVSVTFVDPRTYSVDPSDEYLPVRSKREAGVSNNAIPEDSATAEPSSDLSADDNVLEDFPSEPQYNKGTTSESKYEQDVTDDDVTIEMTSRSAAKVDPVSGGFAVGRNIDNTQHTTDAAVRYNIKRDLSAPTTSSDSPSNPDFLDTVVDNNNNNNNNSNNNNNGLDPADSPDSVNIGVILPFSGSFPWVIQQAHPALKLAVDLIVRKQILPKKKINLVLRDSHCSETYGPLQGIDLYVEKAAHVFVGPACDYAVAPLARFSFRWQIPILTAGALVSAFADRREYRLLTRVQGAYAKAGRFVLTVFERFGWRWAGMIFHDNKNSPNHGRSNFYFIAEAIFLTLRTAYGVEPWHSEYNAYNTTPEEYADILRDMSRKSRDKIISLKSKLKLLRALVLSIFLYASESWTLTTELQKKIQAVEMRCFRKLFCIFCREHITNEEVRRTITQHVDYFEDLLTTVNKRKLRLFGHVTRTDGLSKTILQGTAREMVWPCNTNRRALQDHPPGHGTRDGMALQQEQTGSPRPSSRAR